MKSKFAICTCGVWLECFWATLLWAAPPPGPDVLTENTASNWGSGAENGTVGVYNDTSQVRVGAASLRLDTTGGFDAWMWTPLAKNADWDILGSGAGGFAFWAYAANPHGFQNNSPWVRLYSAPGSYIEYHPVRELLGESYGQWQEMRIPYAGDATWTRTNVGSPDLAHVKYLEIHADTWDAGFSLWIDGLRFDLPYPPPANQRAFAGNHQVTLRWQAATSFGALFDHYAIYRATAPFSNVAGMTPIHTIADVNTTTYMDTTAVNGTGYHYAVTAVLTNGGETGEVSSIGPRTPWDETDLQVVSIARTPRYPRYDALYTYYEVTEPSGFGPYVFSAATGLGSGQNAGTQRWPNVGDAVTYTVTVRNRGTNSWSGTLSATWRVDGGIVSQPAQVGTLQPGDVTTFALVRTWDDQLHDVRFTIEVADNRGENNTLSINTKSVAFLSYIDRTRIESFREETPSYPNPITDDFIDWLNAHMARFNQMFADAACLKRVHYDVLEVLDDPDPDPTVDRLPFAIFPFRYRATEGTLRLSGYYDSSEDLDYGLLHEMGHQLGLIDLYRLNLGPSQNQVSGQGYNGPACLMNGCSHFLSDHGAGAMNHWLNKAHGYYGQYLYSLPNQTRLRILDRAGQPLNEATVTVYQKAERPGLGEVITTQVKAQGTTDTDGIYVLPNVPINPALVPPTYAGDELHDNPFGYVAVVGTNCVLLLKVEYQEGVDFAWLDITEVNNAYWQGQTDVATIERQVALGGPLQYYPPPDLAELNAASWTGWAQDGQLTLSDDTGFKQVGQGSVRIDATGGFDNYVRYPGDQQARWDLSHVNYIRIWFYAVNPNWPGFQELSPWIRLGNANGYYQWRPTWDILNQAIGQWVEFIIPIPGNGTWQRTVTGTPSFSQIQYLEIHADTWGAGFTLWMDGVRFQPRPRLGDLDDDGDVDLADYDLLFDCFTGPGGGILSGCAPADFDHDDADVDLYDAALFQAAFGTP